MPLHAIQSAVAPGYWTSGGLEGRIAFPSWLGRNSTRTKNTRLVKELKTIMSLDTTAGQASIATQYLPLLRTKLLQPLLRNGAEGIQEVIDMMAGYAFTKDDFVCHTPISCSITSWTMFVCRC
jgi:replication factor C subunit 1